MTDPRLFCRFLWAAMASVAICACSCSGNESSAIPRPQAYPRIQLYDTIYSPSDLPAGFEVNSSATVTQRQADSSATSPLWIDIAYPAYGATVSCTFTPVASDDQRQSVIDNRLQRMSLNLGDNFAEQTEMLSPGGYSTIILDCSGPTVTPLQFLSAGKEWIISGAMYFRRDSITTDSVRPAVDAVKNDIIHAARLLR